MNRNDFKAWQPDIVVITLGTNDKTAWSKDALGTSKNTPEKFENAAYSFLVLVRQLNPNAYIAWQFFENDAQVVPILERVVAKFQKNNDQRCSLLLIPPWTMDGCNWHPGVIDHTAAGKKMAQKIATILGLK
jgi:lysophospholipase L1-like esterase